MPVGRWPLVREIHKASGEPTNRGGAWGYGGQMKYKFDEPNIKDMTNTELYEYLTILNILRTRAEIERDNRIVSEKIKDKKRKLKLL